MVCIETKIRLCHSQEIVLSNYHHFNAVPDIFEMMPISEIVGGGQYSILQAIFVFNRICLQRCKNKRQLEFIVNQEIVASCNHCNFKSQIGRLLQLKMFSFAKEMKYLFCDNFIMMVIQAMYAADRTQNFNLKICPDLQKYSCAILHIYFHSTNPNIGLKLGTRSKF